MGCMSGCTDLDAVPDRKLAQCRRELDEKMWRLTGLGPDDTMQWLAIYNVQLGRRSRCARCGGAELDDRLCQDCMWEDANVADCMIRTDVLEGTQ